MYSKISAAAKTTSNSVMRRSAVLQRDQHHHVAGVAAAVDRLLDHLVKFAQDDELLGAGGPLVEVLQAAEHDLVRLALGELEPLVGLGDVGEGGAVAEL